MDDKIECVEYADGDKYWWLHGKNYSLSEWCDNLNLSQEEKCELVSMYG